MRIVGGKYGGRIFRPDKNFKARPTTDIAKEALFNILENRYDFSDKTILDLFSGTGSIAYEFLSRNCKEAVMVEKNYQHYKFILDIINRLEIENASAFKTDVFRYIRTCPVKFDIIFADPPFDLEHINELPDKILNAEILKEGGLFILEHPKLYDFSDHGNFRENRKYGKVQFSFFE